MTSARRLLLTILLILPLGLIVGLLVPQHLRDVSSLGHFIPQNDLPTDYVTGVFWAGLFGVILFLAPFPGDEKKALLRIWLAKCLVTLGMMLFYESNYGLDAYVYYDMGKTFAFDWNGVHFGDGSMIIAGMSWILNHCLLLGDSYHALKVTFSMIGLIGVYLFFKGSVVFLGRRDIRILYLLGLLPSLLFWSSILGKDPVNLLGTGLYFYGFLRFAESRKFRYLAIALAGIGISMMIRVWYGVILLAPLPALASDVRISGKSLKPVFLIVTFGLAIGAFQVFANQFKLSSMDSVTAKVETLSHSWNVGGSAQEVPDLDSWDKILSFAPVGMFSALFRPLPGEIANIFGLMASLENAAFLFLLLYGLRRSGFGWLRSDNKMSWGASLILGWSFIYGFISYQNLGSAVRFKLQVLPILILLIVRLSFHEPREVRRTCAV